MKNAWTERIEKLETEKAELLEACKIAMKILEHEYLDESYDGEAEVIRAAIKKTEGGENE
jgi:uncharacterized protein (UPF0335 family)